jgi:hypothetical protein
MSLIGDPFFEEHVTTELRAGDMEERISSVLLLNAQCIAFENIFRYDHRIANITKGLSI